MAEIDKQIEELKDEERRAARRLKKKELKAKKKHLDKINMKMIIPGDEGPTAAEDGLFRMSDLKSKTDLEKVVEDESAEMIAEDSDSEEETIRPKHEKYNKEDGVLNSEGLWYGEGDEENLGSSEEEDSDEAEELGMEMEDENESGDENEVILQDKESENPLIQSLSNEDIGDKKARKADLWFQKIGHLEDDSDLEEAEIGTAMKIVHKKGGSIKTREVSEDQEKNDDGYKSDSDEDDEVGNIHHTNDMESDSGDDSDDDSEIEHKSASGKVYNKDGFEIVPQQKAKKRPVLSPEELALGEQMIRSKKAKRDIMDNGWHRFMFNDTNLPEWFIKEEEMHMKKRPDVDPDVVEKYKEKGKEVNVKTIKKVVEAKARRKRRVAKKMDRAKKKAENILENADIGSREKAAEINKLYKKAAQAGKSKEVAYVVAKKHKAQKRSQRPAGIKGPYKQVDGRMKKDNAIKRGNAKPGKKRRLKGKQAKPTKQFNTNR